jgi:hypothetical protein
LGPGGLDLAQRARIFDRHRRAARKVLGEAQIFGPVAAVRFGVDERHGAEGFAARRQRHDHARTQVELAEQAQVFGILRGCFQKRRGDLGVKLGFAAANHFGRAGFGVRIGGVLFRQLARETQLVRIAVRHGRLSRARGVGVAHFDRAPIGDHRYGELRDGLQRDFVVERRAERLAGLGQEIAPRPIDFFSRHVAEHEHDAEQLAAFAADGRATVVDRDFVAVARAQHGVVGEPDDGALAQHFRDRALDERARLFGKDVKNLFERAPACVRFAPARQLLGHGVHEAHEAVLVGGDHGVTDAAERDREPAPRLVLAFEPRGAVERLAALARERIDEDAVVGREHARSIKAHPEQPHGLPLDHERHAPKSFGARAVDVQGGKAREQSVVSGFAFGPERLARSERVEGGVAARRRNFTNFFEQFRRDAAIAEQLERLARFVEHVERAGVGAERLHAPIDDDVGDLAPRAHFRERGGDVGKGPQPLARLARRAVEELLAAAA